MVSLTQVQEVPPKNMILLVGPPGAGKSIFCQQAVLQTLPLDKPVIYVTTEYGPSRVEDALKEAGLQEFEPGLLHYVDAYNETVGVSVSDRSDAVHADCNDLSSIDIAISKLHERIGKKHVLLVFDSLTSPYLFSGSEFLRFMRESLSRYAAKGNAVLTCIDEGCGKSEDLVAMMSLANGVIKIEMKKDKQVLDVMKHPKVKPTKIEVIIEPERIGLPPKEFWSQNATETITRTIQGKAEFSIGRKVGDFVNIFWPNLAFWSGMPWDPKRFPALIYEVNKKHGAGMKEAFSLLPWYKRLAFKLLLPKNFSKTKDMKKMSKMTQSMEQVRYGIIKYAEELSKMDEHYFRIHESSECWIFRNVGATMASVFPPIIAGICEGLESWRGLEREWNVIETKCVGLGDPCCEFKLFPRENGELNEFLEKDSSAIKKIHDRLMTRLMGFLLEGKALVERPRLGSDAQLRLIAGVMGIPIMAGERYRMAWRMGGAKVGKEVGQGLTDAGISEDEAVKRILQLLEYCKVGELSKAETIRIKENCESIWVKGYAPKWKEPCCFFTTGFLNGFFSAVKNQHVKETKCIAMGDPYCEWEFS